MQPSVKFLKGGVTAPEGFLASGALCGIKAGRKTNDVALVFSDTPCTAAGVFTKNIVQAECVKLTRKNISNGHAQAIIANSGNANACTGDEGAQNAWKEAEAAGKALCISPNDVIVCSTGVIGQQLPVKKITDILPQLSRSLSKAGHEDAAGAILTTDRKRKECAASTLVAGKPVTVGAMCKGSGMIHINMGTMLCFITTDCAISSEMLNRALKESVAGTFNCVSVDGDTSTNDTLAILANGKAGNKEIDSDGEDYDAFLFLLNQVNTKLSKEIASDGEGASRLIECTVSGAENVAAARVLAKSVISSNLVKAAMFGSDANWGRVLCALGYSGAHFTPEKTSMSFCAGDKRGMRIKVFDHGTPLDFDEDLAKRILQNHYVLILVETEDGDAEGTAWGCDLTYDYVKINGDYRT